MIIKIILSIIILIAVLFILRIIYSYFIERQAIMQLCKLLFPQGNEQRYKVISKFSNMTKNRFAPEDLLDYYLKIKGLHLIDLHVEGTVPIRRFLMRHTRIRLNYMELVRFYDEFLSYRQAVGKSAVEGENY